MTSRPTSCLLGFIPAVAACAGLLATVACGGDDERRERSGVLDGGIAGAAARGTGFGGASTGGTAATGGSGGDSPSGTGGVPPPCPDPDTDPSEDKLCTSNADCCGSGRVCSIRSMPDTETYCAPPNAGGGAIADRCTTGSDCVNTVCLTSSGECSAVCGSDADCDALSPGFVCIDVSFGGSTVGMCARGCAVDSDCENSAHVCVPFGVHLVCSEPAGSDPPGAPCVDFGQCTNSVCVTQGTEQWCSTPCLEASDCPASLPVCQEITQAAGTAYSLCFPE